MSLLCAYCVPGSGLDQEGPVWGSDDNEFPFPSTQRTQTQGDRHVHKERKTGGIVSIMWGAKSLGDRQRGGATIFVKLIGGDKETNILLEASVSVFLSAMRLESPSVTGTHWPGQGSVTYVETY